MLEAEKNEGAHGKTAGKKKFETSRKSLKKQRPTMMRLKAGGSMKRLESCAWKGSFSPRGRV
jgi:hypothetical protein